MRVYQLSINEIAKLVNELIRRGFKQIEVEDIEALYREKAEV